MKKRFWMMLALAVLLTVLWCASAMADDAGVTEYNLWVGGVRVTSENIGNIPGVTGGVARFDPATNTLTLTNVTGITGTHNGAAIYNEIEGFVITGKASLLSTESIPIQTAIYTRHDTTLSNADLTMVTVGNAIYSSQALTINDGCSLQITSARKGIDVYRLIINGGTMRITSSSNSADDTCISVDFFIMNSGELFASSEKVAFSAGLAVHITGGYLDLYGKLRVFYSYSSLAHMTVDDNCYFKTPVGINNHRITVVDVIEATHVVILEGSAPAEYYSIVFDLNGHEASGFGTINVWEGETIEMPADPLVSGYRFGGWYLDAACTQPFDATQPITADITLYAKWTELPRYTVSFAMNGHGTQVETQSVAEGESAVRPATPIDDQYVFDGWFADSALTRSYSFEATPITYDTTIYAKWLKICSVTFVMNGHGEQVAAQTVIENDSASVPATPVDANNEYQFMGWFADAEFTEAFDFSDPITDDTVVYAKWQKFKSVTFIPNGGTGTMQGLLLPLESTYILPECEFTPPNGAAFKCWGVLGGFNNLQPGDTWIMYTDNTFYPKWAGPFTVTFDPNDGTGTMAAVTVGYGEAYTLPQCGFTPPAGKAFSNWNVEKENGSQTLWPGYSLTVYSNVTVSPIWRTARATFQANGGKGILTPVDMVPDSSGYITLPPCSLTPPDGRMFAGWLVNGTVYQPGQRAPLYGDTLIPAQWTTAHYTVTYDKNGGTGSMASFTTQGDTFTLPECGFTPPAGKEFYCWGVPAAVTSYKLYFPGETVQINADTVVQAIWVNETPTTCTVTFDPGDGSGSMAGMTVPYNAPFALPECGFTPPEGCVFAYWNFNSGYANAGDEVTITADTTFTALYRALNQYTVTFDNKWHGTAPESQTVTEGQCVADPGALSEPGYAFEGWIFSYTVSEGGDYTWVTIPFDFSVPVEYYANLRTSGQNEITIDADWTEHLYNVTLNVSDGGTAWLRDANQHPDGWQYGNGIYIDYECDDGWYIGSMTLVPETGESREVYPPAYQQPNFTVPECDVAVEVRFWRPEIESGMCGDLYWTLDNDGTLTITGVGDMPDYSPNNVTPFKGRNAIKRVVVQNGVTHIGSLAFWDCAQLTSVSLPAGLQSIGSGAFQGCGLTGVDIPDSVTTIGADAFAYCPITSVTVPAAMTQIGRAAFRNLSSLTSVEIHDGVLSIGEDAFYNAGSLSGVSIPASVTAIGNGAFGKCYKLTNVEGMEHVETLGTYVFISCQKLTDIWLPRLSVIPARTFEDCRALTNIAIPSSVTSIGAGAFKGCTALTQVYYEGCQAMWNEIGIGEENGPLENATLYCKFALTFETFGGPEIEPVLLDWDEIPIRPDDPKHIGSQFQGWYLEDTLDTVYDFSYPLNADTTLYAEWYTPDPHYTLRLPNMLTTVESEAFAGVKAYAVAVPRSVTFIADDAFSYTMEYVLGFPGSYAEVWAQTHGMAFIEIDDAWLASH